MDRIVYLEISSWVGISLGATHCYGDLWSNGERYPMRKKLTPREAIALNKKHEWDQYRGGDLYSGFDSHSEITLIALETYKTHFPQADILVLGRSCVAEPQKILDGPPEIKEKVNAWYEEAEKIDWYDGDQEERMEKISNEFWEFWIKIRKGE